MELKDWFFRMKINKLRTAAILIEGLTRTNLAI